MNGVHKFRIPHILKKLPFVYGDSPFLKLSAFIDVSYYYSQGASFSASGSAIDLRNDGNLCELAKRSRIARNDAQSALLEYFHSTRGLPFLDAENMSKNAPEFFDSLTKRVFVKDDNRIGSALTRFLRYHPVNEFEPFFESIGLEPSEYSSYLPRDLMFLSEDQLLLSNYHVLCDYGIPRNRIGRIYKEATEIFRFEQGVLKLKFQFFKNLELKQSLIIKIIASCPYLLIGKMNHELNEFLRKLKELGIENDWLENHISIDDLYNWEHILQLMSLLSDFGLNQGIQRKVFMKHPSLLLELSGHATFSLISFLVKFGCRLEDIQNAFLHFPKVSVSKFVTNLRNCCKFLDEIGMPIPDVDNIVRMHSTILGSCELKTVNSLLTLLNCGKEMACKIVRENPEVLQTWVLHVRVKPIQEEKRVLRVRSVKTDFLSSLGFEENSKEMELAFRKLRGKGLELRERFDSLVKMGLSREEATQIVKSTPQILNQSKEIIEEKINFFVKETGYSLSDILAHPRIISYAVERVKLRLEMYKWLREKRMVDEKLALSTLLASSDKKFLASHVNSHPGALEYWKRLKREVYSSKPETFSL